MQGLWRDGRWVVPALLLLAAFAIEAGGEPARLALRYAREAVAGGEAWRLATAHLAHLGPRHLAMNAAALVVIWLLVGANLAARQWWFAIVVTLAVIDLAFWLLEPMLAWYVGLSGLLHGLLATGLAAGRGDRPVESAILGALLVLKLGWEQVAGPLPGSVATAGGNVVVDAHLYGALGGLLAWSLLRIRVVRAASI